jgi:transposase-like protein
MAKNVNIIEIDDIPKCPYCERDLDEIGKVARGVFAATNVYICPHCKKVLGVGING